MVVGERRSTQISILLLSAGRNEPGRFAFRFTYVRR